MRDLSDVLGKIPDEEPEIACTVCGLKIRGMDACPECGTSLRVLRKIAMARALNKISF